MLRLAVAICVALAAIIIALFAIDLVSSFVSCFAYYESAKYQTERGTDGCNDIGIIHAGLSWIAERGTDWWTAFASISIAAFTWTLYRATDKMWVATKIAADSAQKSAEVAAAGLLPAVQIIDVEMSPWTNFVFEEKPAARAFTTLVLSNNGGGIANVLSLHTNVAVGKIPPKDPEPWNPWFLRGGLFIPARGNLRMEENDHQFILREDQRSQLSADEIYLYYWGQIRYGDFFGDESEMGFIWRYRETLGWRETYHPNHTYHRKLPKKA